MSGRGGSGQGNPVLPGEIAKVLPEDTARAWQVLAPHLPDALYLGGGTAVAVHLGHRESRDLDFFFHSPVDLGKLQKTISGLGEFAIEQADETTLKGFFGETKLEIFDASPLKQLAPPTRVDGINVASLQDLLVMKLKVMNERGEMRDYFDVMTIDESTPLSVEEGIELYTERYHVEDSSPHFAGLYLAMGYPDDVEEDEALPISPDQLATWWRRRQAEVVKNSSRFR